MEHEAILEECGHFTMATHELHMALLDGIKNNNLETVEMILQTSPELVNCKFETERGIMTPLIEAIQRENDNLVSLLLKNGADVTAMGSIFDPGVYKKERLYGSLDDVSPLFVATMKCQWMMVDCLLEAGALVDQTTAVGQSPLHNATKNIEYHPDYLEVNSEGEDLMLALIMHGADVNLKDQNGKTPLHYLCENGNERMVMFMLENGAERISKDNNGFTALELAAHRSCHVDLLRNRYVSTIEEEIYACEINALANNCSSPYECMKKATFLRIEHNNPKNVLEPMECYGYAKEWETLEELEKYQNDERGITMQAMLARERIHNDRYIHLNEMLDAKTIRVILADDPDQINMLMKHFLKLFQRNNDYIFFGTTFEEFQYIVLEYFEHVGLDSVTDFLEVALNSCHKISELHAVETRPGASWEMMRECEIVLTIVAGLVAKLMKRNKQLEDEKTEKTVGQEYAKRLLESFSKMSSKTVLLFHCLVEKGFCKGNKECIKYLLQNAHHLDARDNHGNTLLHVLTKVVLQEVTSNRAHSDPGYVKHVVEDAIEMLTLLLDKGAYLHAKNNEGQTVLDILQHLVYKPYAMVAEITHAVQRYDDGLASLKHMTATKVIHFNIPYQHLLPETLSDFVDLH